MTESEQYFRCKKCGKIWEGNEEDRPPECCGEKMVLETLPPCTSADNPEMARTSDTSAPCDDSRGKKS